jgi:hypothetical protein
MNKFLTQSLAPWKGESHMVRNPSRTPSSLGIKQVHGVILGREIEEEWGVYPRREWGKEEERRQKAKCKRQKCKGQVAGLQGAI